MTYTDLSLGQMVILIGSKAAIPPILATLDLTN